jgi:hypothetical protein
MTRPTDVAHRGQVLLCILANPPLGPGERTRARLGLARDILGFETMTVSNLFAVPSSDVTDISALGAARAGWVLARRQLEPALSACDGVLLAYGVAEPTGTARKHHREQVAWVTDKIASLSLPTFQVGDGPRHPSRWQRWTARHHGTLEFSAALRISIKSSAPAGSFVAKRSRS